MVEASCTIIRILQRYPKVNLAMEVPERDWVGWSSHTPKGSPKKAYERQKMTLVLSLKEGCWVRLSSQLLLKSPRARLSGMELADVHGSSIQGLLSNLPNDYVLYSMYKSTREPSSHAYYMLNENFTSKVLKHRKQAFPSHVYIRRKRIFRDICPAYHIA